MAALTTNTVTPQGLRIDNQFVAAAGGGDDMEAGAGLYLIVKNGDASSKTVTIAVPGLIDGDLTVTGRAVVVPATTGQTVIPVGNTYRNPSTGRAAITYSAVTSVTVCVVKTAVQ